MDDNMAREDLRPQINDLQDLVETAQSQPLARSQSNEPSRPYSSSGAEISSESGGPDAQEELHFDVHVSIIFQLGESLISDEIQALIELIKNCYDANASYANVVVDTSSPPPLSERFQESIGFLSIEDDGDGMTREMIVRGWLTISNSIKREIKRRSKTEPLPLDRRTPLGDKGLGRLGAQRLGTHIEVWTRPQGEPVEHYLSISWPDFLSKERLSQVPVVLKTTHSPSVFQAHRHGTRIVISGIPGNDIKNWRDAANNSNDLQRRLSQMLSPYGEVARFRVIVTVDDRRLELAKLAEQVRGLSHLHYDLTFDGETFRSVGRAKLDYFRPEKKDDLPFWNRMLADDGGQGFFQFLTTQYRPNFVQSFGLKRATNEENKPSDLWFVQYEFERAFQNFAELSLTTEGRQASPGPFHGQVDSFNLSAQNAARQNVFDRASEYKNFIRAVNGIRVYRDGFAVRVDSDWLNLGAQQTSGGSYYGMRPDNTLGYIAISARENGVLEETTDREGFKDTPYYQNFRAMLGSWIRWTEQIQEFLRRGWVEYRRNLVAAIAQVEPGAESTETIGERLTQSLAAAKQFTEPLRALVESIDETVGRAQETLTEVSHRKRGDKSRSGLVTLTDEEGADSGGKKEKPEDESILAAIAELQSKSVEVRRTLGQIESYLREVEKNASLSQVLTNQIEVLREQLAEVYETVSLGLTAEVISHDMHLVTDHLVQETKKVRQHLKRRNIRDMEIATYISSVDSSVNALLKQLSRLTPSMRYLREKKEDIDVADFFNGQRDYFRDRFLNRGIHMELAMGKGGNFTLHMNRGKLVQIIDNLLLNSEYWVREEIRLGRQESGLIRIEIAKPFVRIRDNGPGVDLKVESLLFEPFVTTKPREVGRGLGLYIVQQLLDSEGCGIALVAPRNNRGRMTTFELDFLGALPN